MDLKDSGTRREFSTSAVRDCADGKGRCDLLPLGVISTHLLNKDPVLLDIEQYIRTGETYFIEVALRLFSTKLNIDNATLCLEVAKHYEDGARKYSDRNWEKGIPLHCYIDSGVRHYLKWLRGDTDEPHDRAFVWNMLGAIWTHTNKPEMIDLPFNEEDNK